MVFRTRKTQKTKTYPFPQTFFFVFFIFKNKKQMLKTRTKQTLGSHASAIMRDKVFDKCLNLFP